MSLNLFGNMSIEGQSPQGDRMLEKGKKRKRKKKKKKRRSLVLWKERSAEAFTRYITYAEPNC